MDDVQVYRVEVAGPDVGPAYWAFGLDVQRGGDALREAGYQNTNRACEEEKTHFPAEDVSAKCRRERVRGIEA